MALPEGTKLRKGDIVALHGEVKFDQNDDDYLFLDVPGASACMVRIDQIAGIVRRRFDPGDQVKARIPSPYAGEHLIVEAVSECGKSLWLRRPGGTFATLGADEVQLSEPVPVPEIAPEPPLAQEAPPTPKDWDNRRSDGEAAQ